MHLAINACHIDHSPSGAKHRFVGLYRHLFSIAPSDRFTLFEPANVDLRGYFRGVENVEFVPTPPPSDRTLARSLRGYGYWPRALHARRPDVFETSAFPAVIHRNGSTVLTVLDNRYLRHPAKYSAARRLLGRRMIASGIARADVVITISQAMRAEILDEFPLARVEVVGCGLPIEFEDRRPSVASLQRTRATFALPSEYLLSVGHLEKRKNFVNLLKARNELARSGRDLPLVIVGRSADDEGCIRGLIAAQGLESRVCLVHDVSFDDLADFYTMATAFVFPSRYEGFGIPLLEAMHFGCPYVVSDLPVFREITDQRGVYFDPTSPTDMAARIGELLDSSQRQRELLDLGRERLQTYSYRHQAATYAGILNGLTT